jgi:hypothetical protein
VKIFSKLGVIGNPNKVAHARKGPLLTLFPKNDTQKYNHILKLGKKKEMA